MVFPQILSHMPSLSDQWLPRYVNYRRLVYQFKAYAWEPGHCFIPGRVTPKTLTIVFAAFAPVARHKRKCEGFCVYVVRRKYIP